MIFIFWSWKTSSYWWVLKQLLTE